ncbi:hypothetical protein [Elioraea sp. Yellowstone]|nr:hypothetical protein [Elioraea sp. Yellowstone]
MRFTMVLILVLVAIAAAGAVWIGLFPPEPRQQAVERLLPVERFAPR